MCERPHCDPTGIVVTHLRTYEHIQAHAHKCNRTQTYDAYTAKTHGANTRQKHMAQSHGANTRQKHTAQTHGANTQTLNALDEGFGPSTCAPDPALHSVSTLFLACMRSRTLLHSASFCFILLHSLLSSLVLCISVLCISVLCTSVLCISVRCMYFAKVYASLSLSLSLSLNLSQSLHLLRFGAPNTNRK